MKRSFEALFRFTSARHTERGDFLFVSASHRQREKRISLPQHKRTRAHKHTDTNTHSHKHQHHKHTQMLERAAKHDVTSRKSAVVVTDAHSQRCWIAQMNKRVTVHKSAVERL